MIRSCQAMFDAKMLHELLIELIAELRSLVSGDYLW